MKTKKLTVIVLTAAISCGSAMNAMAAYWQQAGANDWKYVKDDGTYMVSSWLRDIDGKWYYMGGDGLMKKGWFQDPSDRKWYYTDQSGAWVTGNAAVDAASYIGQLYAASQAPQESKPANKVQFSEPDLLIEGEELDTTLKDYVAKIDGHTYYREELLNLFLPEELSVSGGKLSYGDPTLERLNVCTDGYMHDGWRFAVYNGESGTFSMKGKTYKNGLVMNCGNYSDCGIYIECDEDYSSLEFTLGHVDNADGSRVRLEVYYMSDDGTYELADGFDLYGEMPVEKISIPIYNTQSVKIAAWKDQAGNTGCYALANMYLLTGGPGALVFGLAEEEVFEDFAPVLGNVVLVLFLLGIVFALVPVILRKQMGLLSAVLSNIMTVGVLVVFVFEWICVLNAAAGWHYHFTVTWKGVLFVVLLLAAFVAVKFRRNEAKRQRTDGAG